MPADKRKSFLQDDSVTLNMCRQECPKYPKQQVCNTLQYLKGNMNDEVDFLPADKYQRFLQTVTIILDMCGQAYPN